MFIFAAFSARISLLMKGETMGRSGLCLMNEEAFLGSKSLDKDNEHKSSSPNHRISGAVTRKVEVLELFV